MAHDFTRAGFQQTFEDNMEVLSIRPQLLRGPLAAATTVYEIRNRKMLSIRHGWFLKDSDYLWIRSIEGIVLQTGFVDAMTNAHDITFKTHGDNQYIWRNVPNANAVKE